MKTFIREIIPYLFIIAVAFLWWPIASFFEAKAYNDLTGKDVSTFQAMFAELGLDGFQQ